MKIKYKTALALCIVVSLIIGCNSKTQRVTKNDTLRADSLVAIDALYFNFVPTSQTKYDGKSIRLNVPSFKNGNNWGVLDAKIDKPKVMSEIQQLVASLEPEKNDSVLNNNQIVVYLNYNSGRTDSLSISYDQYLNRIFLNNKLQKTNNRLLYIIKNNIGLYPWLIGKGLDQQPELYDQSFMKEPFIESKYYPMFTDTDNDN